MEVIWIITHINKDNYERKSKSHVLCLTLQRSLYHISLVGHLFFKCDEMGLSCFFFITQFVVCPHVAQWQRNGPAYRRSWVEFWAEISFLSLFFSCFSFSCSSFLVIVVCFASLLQHKFFLNLLIFFPIALFPFLPTFCRSPEIAS